MTNAAQITHIYRKYCQLRFASNVANTNRPVGPTCTLNRKSTATKTKTKIDKCTSI